MHIFQIPKHRVHVRLIIHLPHESHSARVRRIPLSVGEKTVADAVGQADHIPVPGKGFPLARIEQEGHRTVPHPALFICRQPFSLHPVDTLPEQGPGGRFGAGVIHGDGIHHVKYQDLLSFPLPEVFPGPDQGRDQDICLFRFPVHQLLQSCIIIVAQLQRAHGKKPCRGMRKALPFRDPVDKPSDAEGIIVIPLLRRKILRRDHAHRQPVLLRKDPDQIVVFQ